MGNWLSKLEDTAERDLGKVMRWFGSSHAQTATRVITEIENVAGMVAGLLPDGPELKAGLAFLRTAQDKFLLAAEAAYAAVENPSGVTVTTTTPAAPPAPSAPVAAPAPVFMAPVPVVNPITGAAPAVDAAPAPVVDAPDDVEPDTDQQDSPAGTWQTIDGPQPIPGRDHPITEAPPAP